MDGSATTATKKHIASRYIFSDDLVHKMNYYCEVKEEKKVTEGSPCSDLVRAGVGLIVLVRVSPFYTTSQRSLDGVESFRSRSQTLTDT